MKFFWGLPQGLQQRSSYPHLSFPRAPGCIQQRSSYPHLSFPRACCLQDAGNNIIAKTDILLRTSEDEYYYLKTNKTTNPGDEGDYSMDENVRYVLVGGGKGGGGEGPVGWSVGWELVRRLAWHLVCSIITLGHPAHEGWCGVCGGGGRGGGG